MKVICTRYGNKNNIRIVTRETACTRAVNG